MKKIILLIGAGLLLSGCLLNKKVDETKTTGTPETIKASPSATTEDSLETIEAETDKIEWENFDKDLNNLDQDINQL